MSRTVAAAVLALAVLAGPARAQERASESLRETITAKLQALVNAANAGDADAFFALTSGSQDLVIAGDGRITRGIGEIRANLGEMFVEHGKYEWKLARAEVVTAGSNVVVAVAPCQFTALGDAAAVRLTGAMTVVFARDWFWQDWKVVHSHRSTGKIGVAVPD